MAIKQTIPFNYDDIYKNVEAKFIENGYDTQSGSNTMQLVGAMSYLISMLNANTAANINENLLTLARKRNNILQDARLLGYEPGNKVSYQYQLELTLPSGDFILPKYSEFIAGSKKYYYFGDIINLVNVVEGYKLNITVKEGILHTNIDDPALSVIIQEITENGKKIPQYYVDIPYTDVEDSGIETFLTYYDDDGVLFNKEKWEEIQKFSIDSDDILNKQFYRLDIIDYKTPRIYFKLPNASDSLRLGTKIDMNILASSGSSGEITEMPTTKLPCSVTNYALLIQGTDEESDSSIKYNAPLFWNSANRAVTKNDYLSICERLTTVDKLIVWDGNDEYPKQAGKIWFSFIPGTYTREFTRDAYKTIFELSLLQDANNWFLNTSEVTNIFDYLDVYKIPTMQLLSRNPVFFDFEIDIEILKYDITVSESTQNEIIFNIIDNFFNNTTQHKLEKFETEFFKSNLVKRIDTQTTDNTGVNITLKNTVMLYKEHITTDNGSSKIIIPIGLPYEDIYNINGDLISGNLPDITTNEFFPGKNLTVSWTGLTVNASEVPILEANIKLGSSIVGKYRIFNSKYILIELNIDGTILTSANIDKKVMNVKYKNDNIPIVKNTIPRLKKVNFI